MKVHRNAKTTPVGRQLLLRRRRGGVDDGGGDGRRSG